MAEVCGAQADAGRAEELYNLLEPYAGNNVVVGRNATNYGNASRLLGLLAATRGKDELAEGHYARAQEMHAKMGAKPMFARTQVSWAELLLRGAAPATPSGRARCWPTRSSSPPTRWGGDGRRARPRPRRRPRPRLARAARRLARDRQVDADLDGARQPRRRRPPHALRLRRGVAAQIKLRAERLPGAALEVPVLAETDLDTVLATLDAERPEVCVIDSVQTLHAADLTGAAGSVGQVREVADRITRLAKARDIAVLLVGHVTKEGALAGPRVLEHLVDCVLQFEGERERTYRTLRALKNRFGSTNEAGVFEMRQGGLVEVQDAQRPLRRRGHARARERRARRDGGLAAAAGRGPGARVAVRARPPRRVANGIDRNRLALVLAVLGRHAASGRAAPTCSSTSPAASASTSRAPTSRSRWRWRARARGVVAGRRRAAGGLLRRDRPDRRAALASATPTAGWPRRPSSASGRWSRPAARRPRFAPRLRAALGSARRVPRRPDRRAVRHSRRFLALEPKTGAKSGLNAC